MVDRISTLAGLLRENRHVQCKEQAESVLGQSDLKPAEKAFACFALSRSLAALNAGQEALAPGDLAVLLSRESGEMDLLGEALFHLAALCMEHRLYRRALAGLNEFLQYIACYCEARRLEGKALLGLSRVHQALGHEVRALEYCQAAYDWHRAQDADLRAVEHCRAVMTWQYLKHGQMAEADSLLAESEAYLLGAVEDTGGSASHRNNLAYRRYLTGDYPAAVALAMQVIQTGGLPAEAKVRALITLHYTARALRLIDVARGVGLLARIQAGLAKRPDLEDEATAALVQMQQGQALPNVESLFRQLRQVTDSRQEIPRSQSKDA